MTTKIKPLDRLTTGVPGLDFILAGGLFETGVYIIQGIAGSGKTILANQICFHQAKQKRRAVYFTLLTEAHDRMLGFLHGLDFFDPKHVSDGVTYVSGFRILETEGLPGVVRHIRDILGGQRPSLFVIDGLVSAEELAPNDTAFKKFLHELQTVAAMFRCTVLLLTNTQSSTRLQAEHTMVDGIIELSADVVRLKSNRSIQVSKLRGAGQRTGTHTLEISKQGIRVWPRVETILRPSGLLPRPTNRKRLSIGIPSLDRTIEGGVPSGSNTMLMGPSGIGKTLTGLHFLDAGAAAGEKGLLFTFYEQAEELVDKARRLGLRDFVKGVDTGTIRIVWQSSVEARVDQIGNQLVAAFEELAPSRVFIDGMHGFQVTLDPDERIQDFFAALADHFASNDSTLLFTAETYDLVGDVLRPPFANASRMCQNIFVLRYAELRGRMTRVWSVMKMRDSDYDPSLREVTIENDGIHIGEPINDADKLLSGLPIRAAEFEDVSE
ncbi:MAG TPA: ATPase domain-containing protein [Kofleriaceae bacterium]